jgi:opacity protein-like surface antigen
MLLGAMINPTLAASAAIAISAMLGIHPGAAADLGARPYAKAPSYIAPPTSWTGCFIGGNIGGGWSHFSSGGIAFAGVPFPFIDFGSQNGSSVVGGGQIGCDYQFASNWVIGIQGQGDFGTISSSNPVAAFPGITAQFKVRNIETLTGRVGYSVCKGWRCVDECKRCSHHTGRTSGSIGKFRYDWLLRGWRSRMDVRSGMVSIWRIQLPRFRNEER